MRRWVKLILLAVLVLLFVHLFVTHWHSSANHVGAADLYPNQRLTPGHVDTDMTEAQVCQPGFAQKDRHVTEFMKEKVFQAYGIPLDQTHDAAGKPLYEIDHFVPVILGGDSPDDDPNVPVTANLWPERYLPTPGAYQKDTVEKYLRDAVCKKHTMTLKQAQEAIKADWYKIFLEWQSQPHRHAHPRAGG